ncbi:MAG: adenylate kinase [Candidatus Aenigmatarchaeota archaeon]|nr:MAG: adenylate kinase [Candidatus Aenigmarchaeota archaeon]RLJ07146.1 MAG: adenylate kinase [Candidatus Aenigmarchaeota archaeon]RLJ08542.1 MAG: adenylate kinase [Candidatus Aenigmarchaeota archaeon]
MRFVFLGPPGVGKGTYASRVAPILGIAHISTGDIFREEIKKETELGKKVKSYLESGQLVPDEIVIEVLKQRIEEDDCKKGFILDGFPRTIKQAEELDKITKIDAVINIVLDEDLLVKKISARRICRNCGKIYNIADIRKGEIHLPPIAPKKEGICDDCGGELYQRDDDKEEVVRERLNVYYEQTAPLIDYYKNKGLIREITVTGGPDKMVPVILKIMKEYE